MTTCKATRADGQPCTVQALADGYCFAHSPDTEQKRRAAQAEGGRNRSNAARAQRLLPRDLRPVLALLVKAMKQVHEGQLEPQRLSAMSAAAGAISRLYGVVELQQRVEDLEAEHGIAE